MRGRSKWISLSLRPACSTCKISMPARVTKWDAHLHCKQTNEQTCLSIYVCGQMCVQSSEVNIRSLPQLLSLIWSNISLNLELPEKASEILLSLSSQCWGNRLMLPSPVFYVGAGHLNTSPHIVQQAFYWLDHLLNHTNPVFNKV